MTQQFYSWGWWGGRGTKKFESRFSNKNLYTNAQNSTICKRSSWKQLKCSGANEWISKMGYAVKYYSAITRNEVLDKCPNRMNTENMLSEEARQKRQHIVWAHSNEVSRIDKPIETESRFVIAWGVGGGGSGSWQWLLKGWWECVGTKWWWWV